MTTKPSAEITARYEKLKTTVAHHRHQYHVLDKETISPAALDSLEAELVALENTYPLPKHLSLIHI